MKKILPVVILLVVFGMAAFYFLGRAKPHHPRALELAPAETLFFAHVPDAQGSCRRWLQTGLYQIWREPEMQAFLEQPRTNLPFFTQLDDFLARMQRVGVKEGFVVVTSIDNPTPRFVAGFSYSGRKEEAEALVSLWRAGWRKSHAAGKADLVSYGAREIETFTDKEFKTAEVFCDDWYFVGNQLELLERTMDRHDGKRDVPGGHLEESEIYRQATAPLPAKPEAMIFAQIGTLASRVDALMAAAGQKADPKDTDELRKVKAVSACTNIEGEQFRDTIFLLRPGLEKEPPLQRSTLTLTSPETLFYGAMALPKKLDMPESTMAIAAMVPEFALFNHALAEKQLKPDDFGNAFGPEFGWQLEWPQGLLYPSVLFSLEVRDRAKAQAYVEILTEGKLGTPAWTKEEQNGTQLFTPPPNAGMPFLSPKIAIDDRFVLLGLSPQAVDAGLDHKRSTAPHLESSQAYTQANASVRPPTASFGFIDLGGLFSRSYSVFRPVLAATLAFSPDAGRYIDAGKLPAPEVVSKHLKPIVYSQVTTDQGTLVESTGTLTFNHILAGSAIGAGAAALPALTDLISGGMKGKTPGGLDPSQLFPAPKADSDTPLKGWDGPEGREGDVP